MNRRLAQELINEPGHERRMQIRWASKLSLKALESNFVREFESCLRKYLRTSGLTPKKQDVYVNSVISAVLVLNDHTRKTDAKVTALSRARQARYNARRSGRRPIGPGDISEDEVLPKSRKKKQKAATGRPRKKKQNVARRTQK